MDRPKLKIELESIDKVIEVIGIIGLILLIGLPIIYFSELPETIPRHFGFNGQPDGFSGRGIIWTLPIIGVIMYVGMFWLNKYPHTFNYPQQISNKNDENFECTNSLYICIHYSFNHSNGIRKSERIRNFIYANFYGIDIRHNRIFFVQVREIKIR